MSVKKDLVTVDQMTANVDFFSYYETEAEFDTDSLRCGPCAACCRALARAAGALIPGAPSA